MRRILGVLAGLGAAVLTALIVSYVGARFVPAGTGTVNTSTVEGIRQTYSSLGTGVQLLGVIAWALGALVGAMVAKRLSGRPGAAWTVAGVIEAYMVLNVLMLPMPAWMKLLAVILPLAAGFIANRLIPTRLEVADDGPDATADVEA